MADRPRFRTVFYALAPSWLTTDDGERVLYNLGLIEDMWMERLRQGLNARFPSRAPSDALAVIGRDRRIVKGYVESDEIYASRLIRAIDDWKTAGNPFALMQQVAAYSGVTMMRTVDNSGNWYQLNNGVAEFSLNLDNWDWDGSTESWGRFWLILYSESGPWERDGTWGDGDLWGDDGTTWGSTASPEEVGSIRGIVRDWKPAHARCMNIIVCFDEDYLAPAEGAGDLPDGTWGHWSKNEGGVQVPARESHAIYWDGTG